MAPMDRRRKILLCTKILENRRRWHATQFAVLTNLIQRRIYLMKLYKLLLAVLYFLNGTEKLKIYRDHDLLDVFREMKDGGN
eukprot:gene15959-7290_t